METIETTDNSILYIGTYTRNSDSVSGKGEGIYIYLFNHITGKSEYFSTCKDIINPSYIAIHPNRCFLYCVNETRQHEGCPSGAVSSFAIDMNTGSLSLLNTIASLGADPCYISLDQKGCYVFVANYMGGNIAVFPVGYDGRLGKNTDFIQHFGFSVNSNRQTAPHTHSIMIHPDDRYALCADLGLDKVLVYRFTFDNGTLIPNTFPSFPLQPGSGPRHFVFHPNRTWLYLINELSCTISVFTFNRDNGLISEIQTISALPPDYSGVNLCADIHIHPSGRFLYGSNRGHDSIVMYEIDMKTGGLTYRAHQSTMGKTPRNFMIDKTGKWLLVGNQDSDTIVTFQIDPKTGNLEFSSQITEVPTPVCLKMMEPCTIRKQNW